MQGKYTSDAGNLLIATGGQTQLFTPRFAIVVDRDTETLVVQDRGKDKQMQTPLGIDSLVNLFEEVTVSAETNETTTLLFSSPKPAFYSIGKFTVDIDRSCGRVKRAVLYYAFNLADFYDEYDEPLIPRIEITYENYLEQTTAPANTFSENNFVKVTGDELTAASGFSSYRLIDLRRKQN
jgi:hypothetical protein